MPDETLHAVLERQRQAILSLPGVVGVAEGETGGRPCITVYVVEGTLQVVGRIPPELEGWPVVVRESGELRGLTR